MADRVIVHVNVPREVKPRPRSRRSEVLDQVRTYGGFEVFWACENLQRARAIERLERAGAIVCRPKDPKHVFPWCVYRIARGKGGE